MRGRPDHGRKASKHTCILPREAVQDRPSAVQQERNSLHPAARSGAGSAVGRSARAQLLASCRTKRCRIGRRPFSKGVTHCILPREAVQDRPRPRRQRAHDRVLVQTRRWAKSTASPYGRKKEGGTALSTPSLEQIEVQSTASVGGVQNGLYNGDLVRLSCFQRGRSAELPTQKTQQHLVDSYGLNFVNLRSEERVEEIGQFSRTPARPQSRN
jgi:hypothetical protein